MLLYVKIPENVESRNKWEVIPVGQWLWSSGQRACLRLLRSKFESREVDLLFSKLFEKNENKQKEAGDGPFKKKSRLLLWRRSNDITK